MHSLFRALALLVALALAPACGSTNSPTDPGGGNNNGGTATGSLQINITGLGAGADGALTVSGPSGFSQTVTASETLTGVPTGSYTVNAASTNDGTVTYEPAQTTQTVTVNADQSTLVVVDYVAQVGGLDVQVSGLPAGTMADVEVTGPGSFSQSLEGSATLSDLPVGDYTVTAAAVTSTDGDTHQPSPPSQTLSVPFNDAPVAAVSYSLAAATLEVSVTGLPGGVDAAIEVTGPGGYTTTVPATMTLSLAAPGDYTLRASGVVNGPDTYVAYPFTATVVTVNAGAAESAAFAYQELILLENDQTLQIGQDHGCGIDAAGAVNCWGTGNQGQLGTGVESDQQLSPVGAAAGPYVQVVVGAAFTCARTAAGQADCWGSNSNGETGTGAPMGPGEDPTLDPSPVSGGHVFTQISASGIGRHACGLDQNGVARCWGSNASGQLGDGTTTDRNVPVEVTGAPTFIEIDAGAGSTCALDTTRHVWCWGSNSDGQLGVSNGLLLQSSVPVQMSTDMTFATLGVGGDPCALTETGQVYCWSYQLMYDNYDHVPKLMADGRPFVQLIKEVQHVCGLEPSGSVWCWGYNSDGQLGDGTATSRVTAEEVEGGHAFETITAGALNTCGIKADGTRWCWGTNYWGQLGIGVLSDYSLVPVQIGSF